MRSDKVSEHIYLRRRLREVPIIGAILQWLDRCKARFEQKSPKDYLRMQRAAYEEFASADQITEGEIVGDYVVGSWKQHDEWADYGDYLMRYVPVKSDWEALEYGCGPGRNLRRWSARFARIDGVDISRQNLENARVFLRGQIAENKFPRLFHTSGMDCGDAPRNHYDFAFSTICLQHICVHEVRFAILKSLFDCLKPGGRLSVQMGFGVPSPCTVGYFENFVQATGTNRSCDVAVGSSDEIRGDLEKIGFINFEYWIRPVGPGDVHPQWIFFTALKPESD